MSISMKLLSPESFVTRRPRTSTALVSSKTLRLGMLRASVKNVVKNELSTTRKNAPIAADVGQFVSRRGGTYDREKRTASHIACMLEFLTKREWLGKYI